MLNYALTKILKYDIIFLYQKKGITMVIYIINFFVSYILWCLISEYVDNLDTTYYDKDILFIIIHEIYPFFIIPMILCVFIPNIWLFLISFTPLSILIVLRKYIFGITK